MPKIKSNVKKYTSLQKPPPPPLPPSINTSLTKDFPPSNPVEKAKQYEKNFQVLPKITVSQTYMKEAEEIRKDLMNIEIVQDIFSKEHNLSLQTISSKYKVSIDFILQIIQQLHTKIIIQSNLELVRRLSIGADWLNYFIPPTISYGLLTEQLFDNPSIDLSSTATAFEKKQYYNRKSPEWIASIVWPLLKSKPYCVSDTISNNNTQLIDYMYQNDVRDYVLFDDGAYSGNQKAFTVFSILWNQLLRNDENASFTIYIVIPYITQIAIDKLYSFAISYINTVEYNGSLYTLKWYNPATKRTIYIWTGGMDIPETYKSLYGIVNESLQRYYPDKIMFAGELCEDINIGLLNRGAGLMVLEHKIPDFMSLPSYIGSIFNRRLETHYSNNPPYKKQQSLPDNSRTFLCAREDTEMKDIQDQSGGDKKYIIYKNMRYKVHISKKQNEYILHNNRKIYLKHIKR